jgi:hypothetical protein
MATYRAVPKSHTAAGLPRQQGCGILRLKARETLPLKGASLSRRSSTWLWRSHAWRARQPSIAGDWVSWDPVVRKPCLGISTVQWL